MIHDKTGLLHLAAIFKEKGIKYLIVSPGSRNAPVVSVFCNSSDFKCLTIVDERSAAFFALGMAQQLKKPVAVVCTSGTAVLNYAPAIGEAFYLHVPLVVLTADRPVEWIDQGDGQTIRQNAVFEPHVRKSVQLPQSVRSADDLWYNDRLIAEALSAAEYPVPGPVHFNLPFSEPLYGFDHQLITKPKYFKLIVPEAKLSDLQLADFVNDFNSYRKKMLVIGQMERNIHLHEIIVKLVNDTSLVVLTEATSNQNDPLFFACIDRSLSIMEQESDFQPDMLITIGGAVVSKRIKSFLRKSKIQKHWNIVSDSQMIDVYQKLSHQVVMKPDAFFYQVAPFLSFNDDRYIKLWSDLEVVAVELHQRYIEKCDYSDLKVLDFIFNSTPENIVFHLANSTPVRYAQLFNHPQKRLFFSNRGTSGIDGSISTAAGYSYLSGETNLLISGDLSFFYDSNALWNRHLPNNLKIVVMNNGGGGIFRYIEGPASTGLLEPFFEASHKDSVRGIVEAHGLQYFEAHDMLQIKTLWDVFLSEEIGAAVMEIFTPAEKSAEVLHNYFKALSHPTES